MNKKLLFKKMQGIGNDFVLIDSQDNAGLLINNYFNLNPRELALIANRNYGIGCDQILLVTPTNNKFADFDYLIYNQDGSSAGYCGNGARCVIKYLTDKYHINRPIILNTHGRLSQGYVTHSGEITINMGQPNFDPKLCGYNVELNEYNNYLYLHEHKIINFGVVWMGNPHAIITLENQSQLDNTKYLTETSQAIAQSGLFTNGVNINFFIVLSPDEIQMRTCERGVGFTLACGSGACATASFAIAKKLCNQNVRITMPGGSLHIHWDRIKEIEMTGSANYVFEGSMNL